MVTLNIYKVLEGDGCLLMNQQLLQSWLQLLCKAMSGVRVSCIHIQGSLSEQKSLMATWPKEVKLSKELDDIRQMAFRNAGTISVGPIPDKENNGQVLRVAHPVHIDGNIVGAIGVELTEVTPNHQAAALNLIQWGIGWLELLSKHVVFETTAISLNEILQPLLFAPTFQQAAITTVSLLAKQHGCKRVSLGIKKGRNFKLIAQSHSSASKHDSELGQHITYAMVEALEMGEHVFWEHDDKIHPAHKVLAQSQSSNLVYTLILCDKNGPYGALNFEWSQNVANHSLQSNLLSIIQWLGPALSFKYLSEGSIWAICKHRLYIRLKGLTNKYTLFKNLGIISSVLVFGIILFGNTTYQVGGVAEIQGKIHRALIAPFDGYVANAYAKAGQTVNKDFTVAQLEDKDLRLERSKLLSEKNEIDKQYRKALAALDPSEGRILKAKLAQTNAQIKLINQKLTRTQLTASFNGIIVAGDLSRSIGKPVKKGEVLFEIAPLQNYRVMIEIPDKVIHKIKPNQRGSLVLTSLANEKIPIQVTNITNMPDEQATPGTFTIEAKLIGSNESLRPGMQGYAKLEVGKASRFWVWTHEMINWFRYKLWTWMP